MSLAKQILKNKTEGKPSDRDEFGIPYKDGKDQDVTYRPQYLVARALMMQKLDPSYEEGTTRCLHTRDGVLFQDNMEVTQNAPTFYRLTGVTYMVNSAIQIQFWEELKKRVPYLDTTIYKICDFLWWDKATGEIIEGDYDKIREMVRKR